MAARILHMIGTSHLYQYGVGVLRAKAICTDAQETAFREFVQSNALTCSVNAIAEELNEEGLHEAGKAVSVLQTLAVELDLPHLFCEPNRAERAELGVVEETLIRSFA